MPKLASGDVIQATSSDEQPFEKPCERFCPFWGGSGPVRDVENVQGNTDQLSACWKPSARIVRSTI